MRNNDARDTIKAWLALLFVFLFSGCVLICLGAEFFTVIWLIIYFGAIAMLFIFIIMMLNLQKQFVPVTNKKYEILKIIVPVSLILFFSFVFNGNIIEIFFPLSPNSQISNFIETGLFQSNWDLIKFNLMESPLVVEQDIVNTHFYNNDITIYSRLLYGFYEKYVISAGMMLLVAMIGAMILTKTQRKH